MFLTMLLSNRHIESIPIDFKALHSLGYIEGLKWELEERHEDIIDLTHERPVFFIDNVPSRANFRKNLLN